MFVEGEVEVTITDRNFTSTDNHDVPGIMAAYFARAGQAPVSGLLAGLSLLVSRRLLVDDAAAS